MKPLVAIVGRPNVGKSTFFNKVTGKRLSIVEDKPGVTRDRVYCDAEWCGHSFTLIDTGGLEIGSKDEMLLHIRKQAEIAVETSDSIIFLADIRTGITAEDEEVATFLRRSGKPVYLAVNKADNAEMPEFYNYYSLGFEHTFAVSSISGNGVAELLDELVKGFPKQAENTDDDNIINIAVIGRPNAGKSSLVNKLLGFERAIVTDQAGTTRDAIDTQFSANGQKYNIIDTAGVRRKRSVDEDVEYYSVIRAFAAVRRSDVCLVVIDSEQGISEQDVRLCGYIHEQGKPSVLVMNKWDIIEKDQNTIYKFENNLHSELKFMDYYKSIYVSALTGKRVDKVLEIVNYVYQKSSFRVSTGVLNDVVLQAMATTEPPSFKGRRLKVYYATQADIRPPLFILFANDAKLLHFSYKRYLENSIRQALSLDGTPIKVIVRSRGGAEGDE